MGYKEKIAMTDKEKIDSYLKLAELSFNSFDKRRQYEWKVTLGVWGVLIGISAFVLRDGHRIPLLWLWLVLITALHGLLWLRGVWVANARDKLRSVRYTTKAENVLKELPLNSSGIKQDISRWQWWFGFMSDWSCTFQLATTALLAASIYYAALMSAN